MSNINCSVNNCSHNNSGVCYANRVNISGRQANSSSNTACGSFLNTSVYSTLTNNTNNAGPCSCICCNVSNCTNNCNNLCTLQNISVSPDSQQTNLYSETSCSSFECK
ncbi:MAG: DUF1540 domain-containing protein [Paraclostridium sp.]